MSPHPSAREVGVWAIALLRKAAEAMAAVVIEDEAIDGLGSIAL